MKKLFFLTVIVALAKAQDVQWKVSDHHYYDNVWLIADQDYSGTNRPAFQPDATVIKCRYELRFFGCDENGWFIYKVK